MLINRPGVRVIAGVSLIALAVAAQPAGASTAPDAAPGGTVAAVAGPSVSGHVYDATGAALPGARIVVEGTGAQATTDLQGGFTIATPDATSAVTLLIDYLGRPPATRTVTPEERGCAVAFTLPAAGTNEGDIVVTGASLLDNTARALNQQRTADKRRVALIKFLLVDELVERLVTVTAGAPMLRILTRTLERHARVS